MIGFHIPQIQSETKPSIIFGESWLFPQTEPRFLKHVHDFDNKSQISKKKKIPSEGEKKKHEEVMKPNANRVGEVRKREK